MSEILLLQQKSKLEDFTNEQLFKSKEILTSNYLALHFPTLEFLEEKKSLGRQRQQEM